MPVPADTISKPSERFIADVNADGSLTLSDAGGWLLQAFFLPGDLVLYLVATYVPPAASFLEIDARDYGGFLSGCISAFVWLGVVVGLGVLYGFVRETDRRATRGTARLYAATLRRLRIAATHLRNALRRADREPPPRGDFDFDTNVELSEIELRILRLGADLAPGYAMSVSDVAGSLDLRVYQVRDVLDKLTQRRLLNRTVGGADGESAYTLSAAGRGSLMLRQLAPRE